MGTLNVSNVNATGNLNLAGSWVDAPPGTIIQTVWGGLTASNDTNLITMTSSSATEVDTNLRVTITPKKSNSVMLVSWSCLLYTSPSPRDKRQSRMPSSA